MNDIYHITLLSSREPEAACHGFSTTLCIFVGMPVTSHLIPNLHCFTSIWSQLVVPSYSLYILEIHVNNAGCKYGHVDFHLMYQLLNRHNEHIFSVQHLEYEMCVIMFCHINIFCIKLYFSYSSAFLNYDHIPLFSLSNKAQFLYQSLPCWHFPLQILTRLLSQIA